MNKLFKDYWELRKLVEGIIPRRTQLEKLEKHKGLVKEKGRKVNYQEFSFEREQYEIKQKLLNKEEIGSFLEVSLRAAHCPMPLNADVWDGLRCGFGCKYCFADSFRSSLYSAFFDNSKELGLRHAKPSFFRTEMDKLMKHRGSNKTNTELQKAISLQIPIRLGIRFEDFLPIEAKMGVSLNFMQYLSEQVYPIMVNTKSTLIGREDYVRALSDNKAGAAVHMTMISSDDILNKKLEPGAPPFRKRLEAAKALTDAGVRVVARIEPLMVFINDTPEDVAKWISEVKGAGINHITFDTYSFSASAPGVQRQMEIEGYDFKRMFYLMSDSQWLGSLILGEFMKMLKREGGFSSSTFDFGNAPINDQDICCECEDLYIPLGGNFSWGNNVMAIRFIQREYPNPVTWRQYNWFVECRGGWLSESLKNDVFLSWNLLGNPAYFPDWAAGVEPCGLDPEGSKIWKFNPESDFRLELLENLVVERQEWK